MMGIDLVLPDFTYLRERADDIEAIVITHGHEDHLGALPWVLRELGEDEVPVVYGGQLTIAMARSKLDEHKLREVAARGPSDGREGRGRPVRDRADPPHPLDPRRVRRRADQRARDRSSSPATTSSTRRRSAARRPTSSRLAELGREGLLLLCGDSTNADRPGCRLSESIVGPHLQRALRALRGPDRRHELRVEHPPRPAGRRRRRGARPQGRAGRPVDAQERQHRPLARPHRRARGHARPAARDRPVPRRARSSIISTGSQGEPLSRAAPDGLPRPPAGRAQDGDTVVFSATPIPGNERSVNETIDRLYHIGCDVITTARRADPRLRPRLRRRSSS